MADLKRLISPFSLMPSAGKLKIKQIPRPAPPCNCDSDDENMAPECAFVCNWFAPARKTSRKRNPKKDHHLKKTKRHNKS
jgi:hypothetical protein